MNIGILGVHGSREEHAQKMQQLGCSTVFIRSQKDCMNLDGIILPGGESSSFGRLLEWSGIKEILTEYICEQNMPVLGTCAGCILLAKEGSEYSMKAMDVSVQRNAYGRQVDSFSEEIFISGIKSPFHAIFIRAPKIEAVGPNVKILATYKNSPVLVQEKNCLAATFHPELTNSTQVHNLFLQMCMQNQNK